MKKITYFLATAALLNGLSGSARAQVITLLDQNSLMQVSTASSSGVFNWSVEGVDYVAQHAIWYSIGATAPLPITSLASPSVTMSSPQVSLAYVGSAFTASQHLQLTGGAIGSQTSDLVESMDFNNHSGASISLRLYSYWDFDLSPVDSATTATILGSPVSITQTGNNQMKATTTPFSANRSQISTFPGLLNQLNGASLVTLNNAGTGGPGDMTYAFEWDVTLPNGSVFSTSEDTLITPVPEPASIALFGIGVAGLLALRRRK